MNVLKFRKPEPAGKNDIIELLKSALASAEAGEVQGLFMICDKGEIYSAYMHADLAILSWAAAYATAKYVAKLENSQSPVSA